MSEAVKNSILGDGLRAELKELLREVLREERVAIGNRSGEDRLIDAKEAAKLFSMPKSRIAEGARRGELPSVKMGHYVRFMVSDLREYVEKHRRKKALDKSP